jgi:hypothetical protein
MLIKCNQGHFFISLCTTALSLRKPVSAGTPHDTCPSQGHNMRLTAVKSESRILLARHILLHVLS